MAFELYDHDCCERKISQLSEVHKEHVRYVLPKIGWCSLLHTLAPLEAPLY